MSERHCMGPDGAAMIAAERRRQVAGEGWDADHDDHHDQGEMAWAAVCYAAPGSVKAEVWGPPDCACREAACPHSGLFNRRLLWRDPWPWSAEWDKRVESPSSQERVRMLVKAGALIAAEIDRLRRKELKRAP